VDFSDHAHHMAELVFQGASELDLEKHFDEVMLERLATWQSRPDRHASGSELLRMNGCAVFSITYDGHAGDHWPDTTENEISETLIREFLYSDGICELTDERIRLFRIAYKIFAMTGEEYVLVCPYMTPAGNISGIVVDCVTKVIPRTL
jgi:hypothetical protein